MNKSKQIGSNDVSGCLNISAIYQSSRYARMSCVVGSLISLTLLTGSCCSQIKFLYIIIRNVYLMGDITDCICLSEP